jgi:hypothetical protein
MDQPLLRLGLPEVVEMPVDVTTPDQSHPVPIGSRPRKMRLAIISATVCTTGNPEGVEMTHANVLFEVFAVTDLLPVEFGDRITSPAQRAHRGPLLGAVPAGGDGYADHSGARSGGRRHY